MAVTTTPKSDIVSKFRRHDKDTASPEVQVALLTERIVQLTEHLKSNSKDHHSRMGLFKLVGQRKSMLEYLRSADLERYRTLIKELGLRK